MSNVRLRNFTSIRLKEADWESTACIDEPELVRLGIGQHGNARASEDERMRTRWPHRVQGVIEFANEGPTLCIACLGNGIELVLAGISSGCDDAAADDGSSGCEWPPD
jgi:hypothetical protein